jgi:hypothetical protein
MSILFIERTYPSQECSRRTHKNSIIFRSLSPKEAIRNINIHPLPGYE